MSIRQYVGSALLICGVVSLWGGGGEVMAQQARPIVGKKGQPVRPLLRGTWRWKKMLVQGKWVDLTAQLKKSMPTMLEVRVLWDFQGTTMATRLEMITRAGQNMASICKVDLTITPNWSRTHLEIPMSVKAKARFMKYTMKVKRGPKKGGKAAVRLVDRTHWKSTSDSCNVALDRGSFRLYQTKNGVHVMKDGTPAWLLLEPYGVKDDMKDRLKRLLR